MDEDHNDVTEKGTVDYRVVLHHAKNEDVAREARRAYELAPTGRQIVTQLADLVVTTFVDDYTEEEIMLYNDEMKFLLKQLGNKCESSPTVPTVNHLPHLRAPFSREGA